ncbi:MAG: Maf family protein [Deltaproteobacteria bacterium]|jgi:septum formation protein|nr:Maf family protein [Deltaproteobacteria bacterium]
MNNAPDPILVLASASPRRRELLNSAGFNFTVSPADTDESPLPQEPVRDWIKRVALAKALAVAPNEPTKLILAADTMVVLGERVLGKPKDLAEAKSFLRSLSGATHEVLTAFALTGGPVKSPLTELVSSKVLFRPLSQAEIDLYLTFGESLDKAGGYAIQGRGLSLIQEVKGSLTNVMGLPLPEVIAALKPYF